MKILSGKQNDIKKYHIYIIKFRNIFKKMEFLDACKFLVIRYFIEKIYPWYFIYILRKKGLCFFPERNDFFIKKIDSFDKIPEKDIKILQKEITYSNLFAFKRSLNYAVLWFAYIDGNLAAYCWSKIGIFKKDCLTSPNKYGAYIFDYEVFVRYRGKGVMPLLYRKEK